ncbi:UbiX family flavin prenyltransferase [Pseudobutyrivibrio sp.]|uniref:UbiX family flavin prenyltransferase n=1 Tax=Pseudobutyrivibrio sp. TaxID=2014367 RepID=UPI001E119AAD|nr:UbiX family flavin prenyltransferase [Pseudobutyrivibrio sp.]MBE5912220.1 UbiX family flavin prenyltransferase [Pseudobutyrivibrio sp.]
MKKRLIVGVSGASGAPLALKLLKELKKVADVESHLVITHGGELTIEEECGMSLNQFCSYADVCYNNNNIGATLASGTYKTLGMVVCPCSMKTVAGIAHGYSDNLLLRAADVALKEQRKLVLVTRESPLSKIHLDNMAYLAGIPNVFIMPPVISYYSQPKTLADVEQQIVGRILDRFDIDAGLKRWNPHG